MIENEVNLTYQATITIKPQQLNPDDPNSGYWPTTAREWSLTSKLNGDPMPDVRTDSMNPDGRTSSEPIVLHVTAPFGGKSIQWSFVVQDESGFQVGTGVSAVFPNDDPDNVASEVEFSIVEVPEPITANTVFKRGDSVTYSDSVGGYTWNRAGHRHRHPRQGRHPGGIWRQRLEHRRRGRGGLETERPLLPARHCRWSKTARPSQ